MGSPARRDRRRPRRRRILAGARRASNLVQEAHGAPLLRAPPAPSFFASFSKSALFSSKLFQRFLWRFCGISRGYNRSKPKESLSKFLAAPASSQRPAHAAKSVGTGSSGHPRSSTFPRIDSYRPESRCVCCRRNLLRPSVYFAGEGKISLAKRFCFARHPRKLLKSLGREISDFAVSCDFKGLRPIFFALSFRRPFSDPPFVPSLNLVSQKLLIARIRFQGKLKRESCRASRDSNPISRLFNGLQGGKVSLVFVINPSPGAGMARRGLQGSPRREGSTAIGFAPTRSARRKFSGCMAVTRFLFTRGR